VPRLATLFLYVFCAGGIYFTSNSSQKFIVLFLIGTLCAVLFEVWSLATLSEVDLSVSTSAALLFFGPVVTKRWQVLVLWFAIGLVLFFSGYHGVRSAVITQGRRKKRETGLRSAQSFVASWARSELVELDSPDTKRLDTLRRVEDMWSPTAQNRDEPHIPEDADAFYLASSKFIALTREQFTQLYARVEWVPLEPGDFVFEERENVTDAMYIVASGAVELSRRSPGGDSVALAQLQRSDLFGEMELLFDFPRDVTCKAVTRTSALKVTRAVMDAQPPSVRLAFLRTTVARNWRVADFVLDDFLMIPLPSAGDKNFPTNNNTHTFRRRWARSRSPLRYSHLRNGDNEVNNGEDDDASRSRSRDRESEVDSTTNEAGGSEREKQGEKNAGNPSEKSKPFENPRKGRPFAGNLEDAGEREKGNWNKIGETVDTFLAGEEDRDFLAQLENVTGKDAATSRPIRTAFLRAGDVLNAALPRGGKDTANSSQTKTAGGVGSGSGWVPRLAVVLSGRLHVRNSSISNIFSSSNGNSRGHFGVAANSECQGSNTNSSSNSKGSGLERYGEVDEGTDKVVGRGAVLGAATWLAGLPFAEEVTALTSARVAWLSDDDLTGPSKPTAATSSTDSTSNFVGLDEERQLRLAKLVARSMAPRLRQFQRYGMRRQWFRAGQTIYRPGDPCANLYIVLSGRVAITSPNPTPPVPPAASGDPDHEPSTPNNTHTSSSTGYEFFPGGNQWSGATNSAWGRQMRGSPLGFITHFEVTRGDCFGEASFLAHRRPRNPAPHHPQNHHNNSSSGRRPAKDRPARAGAGPASTSDDWAVGPGLSRSGGRRQISANVKRSTPPRSTAAASSTSTGSHGVHQHAALCVRDTEVVLLSSSAFELLVADHPEVLGRFAEILAQRLQEVSYALRASPIAAPPTLGDDRRRLREGGFFGVPDAANSGGGVTLERLHNLSASPYTDPKGSLKGCVNIALVAVTPRADVDRCSALLRRALNAFGPVEALSREVVNNTLGTDICSRLDDYASRSMLTLWLSSREKKAKFLVLECEASLSLWTACAVRAADVVLLVANASDPPDVSRFEHLLFWTDQSDNTSEKIGPASNSATNTNTTNANSASYTAPTSTSPSSQSGNATKNSRSWATQFCSKQLVLVHGGDVKLPTHTKAWFRAPRTLADYHHVQLDADPLVVRAHFQRLARSLTGHTLGLVMGGGGARGLAHLGVVRAAFEQGLPIDAVGGTSQGALMGALLALQPLVTQADSDAYQLRSGTIAAKLGSVWALLQDLTVPLMSYFSGSALSLNIAGLVGEDTQIEDLWLKFFCISTNVTRGDIVVHRFGSLWQAIRASMSLLAFLPPMQVKVGSQGHNYLLIDGGYINNLPADVMHDTFRPRLVVGVDVENKDEDHLRRVITRNAALYMIDI
jgi:CRP-like cAMP-binding protein